MDVVIAYSVRKQTPKNFEEYFEENIRLIRVENFTRNLNPLKDIKAILEVKKILKQEKPDFLHMHSSKARSDWTNSHFTKKSKIILYATRLRVL